MYKNNEGTHKDIWQNLGLTCLCGYLGELIGQILPCQSGKYEALLLQRYYIGCNYETP